MKKIRLTIAGLVLIAGITSCSDSGSGTTTNDSANSKDTNTAGGDKMNNGGPENNPAPNTSATTKMPYSKEDSTFVMKAAMGGMMEVQAGNLAQANAANDRVKNYGKMMVTDHSKANSELMALASGRGLMIPAELPADMKQHTDAMAKMKGKSFDSHYLSMMTTDHKKDIALFEKQAGSGNDADLKAFAARTLPTLKMHMDSVQAISKAKM